MGLFSSKDKKERSKVPELPKLPDLPDLDIPDLDEMDESNVPHKLPSIPQSSFGEKFSQNSIKNAVSGKGYETPSFPSMNEDYEDEDYKEVSTPPKINPSEAKKISFQRGEQHYREKREEPVFIQIEKFEESLEIFKETKEKIKEIEDMLSEVKDLKRQEEDELSNWQKELKEMKERIEKVDSNIFSKI